MNKVIAAFGFVFCSSAAFSQLHIADSANYSLPAQQAIATFQQALPLQKEIYSGPEHFGYLPTIEGLAYYKFKEWQPGSVFYDGLLYPNEWLKYDVAKDKLVLKRFDEFAIELRSEKVLYFTMYAHTFIYIAKNDSSGLAPGFYERLADGALMILEKHSKRLEEKTDETKFHQRYIDEAAFYAVKNNRYAEIKNLQSLCGLVGSKKSEMQQLLKKGGLKFKKNKEQALVAIADFYNKN